MNYHASVSIPVDQSKTLIMTDPIHNPIENPKRDDEPPSKSLLILLVLPLTGLFIALLMLATEGQNQPQNPQATFQPALPKTLLNFQAPDFELPTLDGKSLVSMRDFRGRPVFVNFWATWCIPCVRELPAFEEFISLYADDPDAPVLLAINMGETAEEIQGFLDKLEISSIPILLDANQVVKADYGVQNLPTTYLIDETGMIRAMKLGEMRFDEMGLYLQELDKSE